MFTQTKKVNLRVFIIGLYYELLGYVGIDREKKGIASGNPKKVGVAPIRSFSSLSSIYVITGQLCLSNFKCLF